MLELLRTRRSIRNYQDRPVEADKIDTILKAALMAPSSRSRNPWEFIVVTDKDKLMKLSQCREASSSFLAKAPVAIVIAADPNQCDVWIEDCSITAIIMQLTAHSIGIGSCWIQVRERFTKEQVQVEDYIKDELEIPKHYHVECMIALGYSAEEKKVYEDKNLMYHKIHREGYQGERA